MSRLVVPARRIAGLEALELASYHGLTVWLMSREPGELDRAMDAGQAWPLVRQGSASASEFYTFEPAE